MTTAITPKILLLTYYWPPSGGSGVQRWMYFAKHLKALGWEPIVITVAPNVAAYPVLDSSLALEVENITVIRTASREPLRWYQRWYHRRGCSTKKFAAKIGCLCTWEFFPPRCA